MSQGAALFVFTQNPQIKRVGDLKPDELNPKYIKAHFLGADVKPSFVFYVKDGVCIPIISDGTPHPNLEEDLQFKALKERENQ